MLKKFIGTSSSGNISEALQEAIKAAIDGLPANHVNWTLDSIEGEFGGIIEKNTVSVKITARPHEKSTA